MASLGDVELERSTSSHHSGGGDGRDRGVTAALAVEEQLHLIAASVSSSAAELETQHQQVHSVLAATKRALQRAKDGSNAGDGAAPGGGDREVTSVLAELDDALSTVQATLSARTAAAATEAAAPSPQEELLAASARVALGSTLHEVRAARDTMVAAAVAGRGGVGGPIMPHAAMADVELASSPAAQAAANALRPVLALTGNLSGLLTAASSSAASAHRHAPHSAEASGVPSTVASLSPRALSLASTAEDASAMLHAHLSAMARDAGSALPSHKQRRPLRVGPPVPPPTTLSASSWRQAATAPGLATTTPATRGATTSSRASPAPWRPSGATVTLSKPAATGQPVSAKNSHAASDLNLRTTADALLQESRERRQRLASERATREKQHALKAFQSRHSAALRAASEAAEAQWEALYTSTRRQLEALLRTHAAARLDAVKLQARSAWSSSFAQIGHDVIRALDSAVAAAEAASAEDIQATIAQLRGQLATATEAALLDVAVACERDKEAAVEAARRQAAQEREAQAEQLRAMITAEAQAECERVRVESATMLRKELEAVRADAVARVHAEHEALARGTRDRISAEHKERLLAAESQARSEAAAELEKLVEELSAACEAELNAKKAAVRAAATAEHQQELATVRGALRTTCERQVEELKKALASELETSLAAERDAAEKEQAVEAARVKAVAEQDAQRALADLAAEMARIRASKLKETEAELAASLDARAAQEARAADLQTSEAVAELRTQLTQEHDAKLIELAAALQLQRQAALVEAAVRTFPGYFRAPPRSCAQAVFAMTGCMRVCGDAPPDLCRIFALSLTTNPSTIHSRLYGVPSCRQTRSRSMQQQWSAWSSGRAMMPLGNWQLPLRSDGRRSRQPKSCCDSSWM